MQKEDEKKKVITEFKNLWDGKERKVRYYDGGKDYDNSEEVKRSFKLLWNN